MSRRVLLLVLIVLTAGCYGWFDVRQRARVDRGVKRHRTDFTVYQAASRALAEGADPYDAVNPRGYRYVYPPLLAVLLLPVSDWAPEDAATLWYALSVLALAAASYAVSRWPRSPGGPNVGWRPVLVAGFGICVGFAHQGFQRGQVTHVLLALHVLALSAWFARRHATAGLLLALGAALRLTPLLAAAVLGLHVLLRFRRDGAGPTLRYSAGLGGGLLLGFVLVPLAVLGAERARAVTGRWLEVTGAVYAAEPGALEDLGATYRINEYRFKNQAPRRVAATWAGWLSGAGFENERPKLSDGAWVAVDGAARVVGWAVVLGALVGVVLLRGRPDAGVAGLYALAVLAPVLVTRYAWPTHFLLALPALALALAAGRRRGALVFFAGTALFYAAHAKPLAWLGAAGCLLVATVVLLGDEGRAVLRRGA